MIIKIDTREKHLIALLTNAVADASRLTTNTVVVEALPLADVIICDDDGTERVMIERKTLRDLASSITDGRYKEQSHRLTAATMPNHNIIYLVEGDMNRPMLGRSPVGVDALWTAMITLSQVKGFSVFRTMNLAESATLIERLASKLKTRSGVPDVAVGDARTAAEEYADVVKRVKKENIVPENAGIIMLAQIPGISVKVATALMREYRTLAALMEELTTNPGMLNGLTIECGSGRRRCIPKQVPTVLRRYLQIGVEGESNSEGK
jgi:ERCC4-type nuclease